MSYLIVEFNKDSLLVRRPLKYHDTIVECESYSVPYIGKEYCFKKFFRENGRQKGLLNIIDEFQYELIDTKKITSLSYPPKSDDQVGCIFCIFIPIYNLFYLHNARKYYIPKKYELEKWELKFE